MQKYKILTIILLIFSGLLAENIGSTKHKFNYPPKIQKRLEQQKNSQYKRILKTGWNWICFPRLERVNYQDGEIDSTTLGKGKYLGSIWEETVTGGDPNYITSEFGKIAWNSPSWMIHNYLIESKFGYRLKMVYDATEHQLGELEDPETIISLTNLEERSWDIGYFLEDPALITEVIPATLLECKFRIKTQSWCAAYDPRQKDNNGWSYDTSFEPAIQCGQMINLQIFGIEEYDFIWQKPETKIEYKNRMLPKYFSFEEQEDYLPVFIKLDPIDLPTEIGLYIDGICKGAAIVESSPKKEFISQINLYLMDAKQKNWQDDFEIIFYYKNMETRKIQQYAVYQEDLNKFIMDDLKLVDLKRKDQLNISLIKQEWEEVSENEVEFTTSHYTESVDSNFPERHPVTYFYFSLPATSETSLEIYNAKKQKIRTLIKGKLEQGEHQITWDGTDSNRNPVSSGIYFYRLQSEENVIDKKMMLMK